MRVPNTLAFAVASGRIGYVYLCDGEVRDWGTSSVSARSPEKAQAYVKKIIGTYCAQLIVTERLTLQTRKGRHTRRIIEEIERTVGNLDIHAIDVERVQHHENKYLEIEDLAKRYPVLEPWKVAKRKAWEGEHRNTIIWEALTLVDQINS